MDRRITPKLAAVSLFSPLAHTAFPVMAGDDSWTVAGSPPGGGVFAVAVDPVTPSIIYAVSSPGIFESQDSGSHWKLALQLPGNNASDVAIEPEDHATAYVATQGDGIFVTRDSGTTWNPANTGIGKIGGGQEDSVYRVSVDPVDDGTAYALTLNTGVYKTIDHGAHWQAVNTGITQLQNLNVLMNRLLVDPVAPNVLYLAVTEFTDPTSSDTSLAGLYTSTDGGAHWAVTSISGESVWDLDIDPSDHTHLLADSAGLLSITGSGASSTVVSGVPAGNMVRFDPSNALHIFVEAGSNGLYQSTDGGTTWVVTTGSQGLDLSAFAIDPVTPANIYASSNAWGVFTSSDSGSTWSPASNGIYNVVPNVMFEGPDQVTYLASAGSGIYKSPDQGVTWSQVGGGVTGSLPAAGDFVYSLVEHPTASSTLYAGTTGGIYMTTDGGNTWTETDSGVPDSGYTLDLAMDPEVPTTLYAATNTDGVGVYKSVDGGTTWTAAGAGLSISSSGGFQALAVDPHDSNVVYAGAYATGLYKSTDGATTWQADVTGMGVTDVWAVAVDPNDSNTVYASTTKGFYKSTDAGASWQKSDSGLNGYVMTFIQIDPADTSIIYVSPRYGIGDAYVSTDAGAHWNALSSGLAASAARAKGVRRTASIQVQGGRRVTRSTLSQPVTINAVAIDPQHHTQILGAGSDGQVYAYDNTGSSSSSSGGSTGSGGGTKPPVSGGSGGGGGNFGGLGLGVLLVANAWRRRYQGLVRR